PSEAECSFILRPHLPEACRTINKYSPFAFDGRQTGARFIPQSSYRSSFTSAWPPITPPWLLPPPHGGFRLRCGSACRPGVILLRCAAALQHRTYPVPPSGMSLRMSFVLAPPLLVVLQWKHDRLPLLRGNIPPPGGLLLLFGRLPRVCPDSDLKLMVFYGSYWSPRLYYC